MKSLSKSPNANTQSRHHSSPLKMNIQLKFNNTNEIFGISTNKESGKFRVQNKDNSNNTSMSKSSESRGASLNSVSKYGASVTFSTKQRSSNSKESITKEANRPQINIQPVRIKIDSNKSYKKENIPWKRSTNRLNTIFDKQEGFADIALKESSKLEPQKLKSQDISSNIGMIWNLIIIVECKLNAMPTFVQKPVDKDESISSNPHIKNKKNSELSIVTDLKTESLYLNSHEKDDESEKLIIQVN